MLTKQLGIETMTLGTLANEGGRENQDWGSSNSGAFYHYSHEVANFQGRVKKVLG